MPRFSRHIGIEPVFVWFGQVAAPMHCEFRLQCESHCEQDMGTEKSRALSSILVCGFVLSFCHSILSLFCLFRWLFAHFNYYYQMRNNVSFEIKHQFHFQVIYTFCSIKRIADSTLGEKNVYCSVFNILFNSFCYSFSLYICAILEITVQICLSNANFFLLFVRLFLISLRVVQMRNELVVLETILFR